MTIKNYHLIAFYFIFLIWKKKKKKSLIYHKHELTNLLCEKFINEVQKEA